MKITLQNVKRQFEQWRAGKKNQREKIPEELLKLASACGFKFGYCLTLKELNLSTLKLNLAMKTYPAVVENKEQKNLNSNKSIQNMEFIKATFKEAETENSFLNTKKEFNPPQVLYELENKLGIKVRVFSDLESLQKNIFSAFSFWS